MKTRMSILWNALAFLAVLGSGATSAAVAQPPESLALTLEIPPLSFTRTDDGFDRPEIAGFGLTGAPGDPALPGKTYNIALPPDVAWESMQVETVAAETLALSGTYRIAPAPPIVHWEDGQEQLDWGESAAYVVDGLNTRVYENDAYFPASYTGPPLQEQMRKWRFIRLLVTPLQVNPVGGKARLATEIQVRVTFRRDPDFPRQKLQLELADATMDDVAAEMFVNYDQARAWYYRPGVTSAATLANSRYVIITTNAIVAASGELNAFIAHKQAQGFTVEVVTESQYGPLTGQNPDGLADKIRKWLLDNYLIKNIAYVLLIGDPSPVAGDVPMKMLRPQQPQGGDACYDESPSDYYYADLTGDWDLNGNGTFGEFPAYPTGDRGTGGIDLAPEVYVGRIPVYSSVPGWATTLDDILQRTIEYEDSGSQAWRKTALLPMGFYAADADGAYLGQHMQTGYLDGRGYTSYTLYQQTKAGCDSSFTSSQDLTDGAVRDHWKNNPYGIVTWQGHGGEDGTGIGYDSCTAGTLLNTFDTEPQNNNHPPRPAIVYQGSCANGWPDNANNLGYALLRNRWAIATFSASRCSGYAHGAFSPGGTDPFNANLGYTLMDRVTQGEPLGQALYLTKSNLDWVGGGATNDWGFLTQSLVYNLYGDPSLSITDGHPWPPAAAGSLMAGGLPQYKIGLWWSDNSDNEDGFRIERSPNGSSGWAEITHTAPNVVTYTDDLQASQCGQTFYYRVTAYNDDHGSSGVSDTASGTVIAPDAYEVDDSAASAQTITTNGVPQAHTFHCFNDYDWVKFTMTAGMAYTITTSALGAQSDTILELYDTNGLMLLTSNDNCTFGNPASCIKGWTVPTSGTYYVRVRNAPGSGGCTDYDYKLAVASGVGSPGLPNPPSTLIATSDGFSQVNLAWGDNSNDEQGFKIERFGCYGASQLCMWGWQQIATVGAGVSSYQDTGLVCGRNYAYRVRAYNASGNSAYSNTASATTPVYDPWDNDMFPPYLNDDTYLEAKSITVNGAPQAHNFHAAWDADWVKFTAVANRAYTVTTSNLGSANDTVLELYATDGTTLLEWNDDCWGAGLASCIKKWVAPANGTYYVKVRNYSSLGGCPGYDYNLAVTGVSGVAGLITPSGFATGAFFHSQINLSWTDGVTIAHTIEIERWEPFGRMPGFWRQIAIVGPSPTSGGFYADAGLPCATEHRYRIRALNADGSSAYTAIASATTTFTDAYESDNITATASIIAVNGGAQYHNLYDPGDEDWIGFAATAGEVYTITASGFTASEAISTSLALYDGTGTAVLATGPACGGGVATFCINGWVAPSSGLYYVRVTNPFGNGCPGYDYELAVVDSHLSDQCPTAPTGLTALATAPDRIHLAWVDDSINEQGFRLERRFGNDWLQIAELGAGVSGYDDARVMCGGTYEYRVFAYNASCGSGCATVTAAAPDCFARVYLPLVLKNQ